MAKCANLEKQKSRLQSEVEILIMDLEKATTHAQQLEKRCSALERSNIELKSKIEEITMLLESAQRDARQKAMELQKLTHEFEKLRELKEQLARENKKLSGMCLLSNLHVFFPKMIVSYLITFLSLNVQQTTWEMQRTPSVTACEESMSMRLRSSDWRPKTMNCLLPTKSPSI